MKFKTSIGDGAFLGLMVFCLLTLAMYIYWVVSAVWWPAVALSAVLIVVIVPIYFGTKYVLTRDRLNIYCGVFCRTVPYRNIISVTDANCITPAYAMSHKRICLRYLDGDNIKVTYISPTNRDAFRDALNTAMQKSIATLKSQGDTNNIEAIEAVEAIKVRLAQEHEISRAEERALAQQEDEQKNKAKEDLAREIKKLDAIIDGNLAPESVVLSQEQENIIASRRAAERKLLAKVRKLKHKKDKAEAKQLLIQKQEEEFAREFDARETARAAQKAAKEEKPKLTADQKFAENERKKAEKFKQKEEKRKQKAEKQALAKQQEDFESESVLIEPQEEKQKPQIEKIKSKNKDKINTAKPKKQKNKPATPISQDANEASTEEQQAVEKDAADAKAKKSAEAEAKKLQKEQRVNDKKAAKEQKATARQAEKEQKINDKQSTKAQRATDKKAEKEQRASNKKFEKEVKAEAKKLKKEAAAEAKAEKKSSAEQLAKKAAKSQKNDQ